MTDNLVIGVSLGPAYRLHWQTEDHPTGLRVLMERGTLNLSPPGTRHRGQWDKEANVALLQIHPQVISAALDGTVYAEQLRFQEATGCRDEGLAKLIESLVGPLGNWPDGLADVSQLGLWLAKYLVRDYAAGKIHLPEPRGVLSFRQLRRVLDYVHENMSSRIELAGMAREVSLSLYHFAHQFEATTGVSPYRYVLSCRFARSKSLLMAGHSVGETAAKAGFVSPSHFSRFFQSHAGISPRKFRQSTYGR